MSKADAQSQAQSAWGAEGQQANPEADGYSQSGSGSLSREPEDFSQRAGRTIGSGAIIGGILTRMIADKHERIREVDECLEWYAREKLKRLEELGELEKLASELGEISAPE